MASLTDTILFKFIQVHDFVYQRTQGWIGHRVPGAPPNLLLHTVGAKTGMNRTNSLTYARDGDAYLVVASKAGAPTAPGWYHNLRADPDVEVNVGPTRYSAVARPVLPDDPDYPRLWKIVDKNNGGRYQAYQARTSRQFPIIELKLR